MYDCPGHQDFSREVSRCLSFVQGAILLLDATQGIQAQTWSVHEKASALEDPPELLMALTKIDLELARPVNVALSICECESARFCLSQCTAAMGISPKLLPVQMSFVSARSATTCTSTCVNWRDDGMVFTSAWTLSQA